MVSCPTYGARGRGMKGLELKSLCPNHSYMWWNPVFLKVTEHLSDHFNELLVLLCLCTLFFLYCETISAHQPSHFYSSFCPMPLWGSEWVVGWGLAACQGKTTRVVYKCTCNLDNKELNCAYRNTRFLHKKESQYCSTFHKRLIPRKSVTELLSDTTSVFFQKLCKSHLSEYPANQAENNNYICIITIISITCMHKSSPVLISLCVKTYL